MNNTSLLRININHAEIINTNFWQTEYNKRGLFFASYSAGAIRLLVPNAHTASIPDMLCANEVIITRGQHRHYRGLEMTEILFEDHSLTPLALCLSMQQWDMYPAPSNERRIFSLWKEQEGAPVKIGERSCYMRRAVLPCLKPWKR